MRGDGNCQFRALADQLFGDQERHAECRAVCMNQLRAESEHYRVSMFLFSLTSQFTDQQSHVYFILVRAIRLTAICLFTYLPIYRYSCPRIGVRT